MFVLARGSRLVPLALLTVAMITILIVTIMTSQPGSTAIAVGMGIGFLALFWLIRAWSNQEQAVAVRTASGAETVIRARLTRKAYQALRPRINAGRVYYQAAIQVWLAFSQDSLVIYCPLTPISGRAVALSSAIEPTRRQSRRSRNPAVIVVADSEFGDLPIVLSREGRRVLRRAVGGRYSAS
ncbi:hypothetical protein KNO15_19330 [Leifsonia shinshuensis]|uniref:hypothetical protein n=1 Tax=Leifsonia shinshuensis TaxID=150026 RepID=UPI001F51329F|nr:hypothetical protein [Leifsonia shinshuensis]MCI0158859.1 hypothetical protein [Leifsonia shinshuensis]